MSRATVTLTDIQQGQAARASKRGFCPPSKYRSKWTSCGSHMHQSAKEALRCTELYLLWRSGEIEHLQIQVPFVLEVNGVKLGKYVADFSYVDARTRARTVEDVKGMRTSLYVLKKKLMRACYGIDVLET